MECTKELRRITYIKLWKLQIVHSRTIKILPNIARNLLTILYVCACDFAILYRERSKQMYLYACTVWVQHIWNRKWITCSGRVSLLLRVLMSRGLVAERVREGKNFLKQGLKQGLLVHSGQTVNDGSRWTLDFSFVYCIKI